MQIMPRQQNVIPIPTTRPIFGKSHHAFRERVRDFLTVEILPEYPDWMTAGQPSRRFWERAGDIGILGIGVPEEYGGLPDSDFRHSMIVTEEIQRLGLAIGGLRVQTDICTPYFLHSATASQRQQWLPQIVTGQTVMALGLSEPGAGSDLKALRTRAIHDGDEFVVDGAKTFISNGSIADLVVLAVKTDPAAGRQGISLLLVPTDTHGFTPGRKLHKLGLHAQDLAELSFTAMRVPATSLLGEQNQGFAILTSNLAAERLSIAVNSQAAATAALEWTVEDLAATNLGQDAKFTLAALAADVAAGQTLIDRAVQRLLAQDLSGAEAAAAKLFCTELQGRVVRQCLSLSTPGPSYRTDSRLGQAYLDGRVSRIYGGSTEIMKVIIGRDLGL